MSIDSKQVEPRGAGVPAVNGLAAGKAKRVLVVSYDFPPNRTSAVYRMTGLTKYLCDFGWAAHCFDHTSRRKHAGAETSGKAAG